MQDGRPDPSDPVTLVTPLGVGALVRWVRIGRLHGCARVRRVRTGDTVPEAIQRSVFCYVILKDLTPLILTPLICGLVAAPGPVLGQVADPCPHGVEHHVARQLQQVGFALHDDGFESTLKDVTDPAVGAVVRTRR